MLPTGRPRRQSAGFPPDHSIVLMTNKCIRTVVDKRGIVDDVTIQKQIDVFLKECVQDQTSATPGICWEVTSFSIDSASYLSTASDSAKRHILIF